MGLAMGTDTSKSLFDQAMKDILLGNYVAAELALEQASEVNEENTTIYAASWAILLALRNREEEAITILEERLENFSTDPNLLLAYGITLERQGNLTDAEDAYKEVLAQDEENPGALNGMATCLKVKGDFMGATRLAAKAFAIAPDNMIFAKNAANLLEKMGQTETCYQVLYLGANYHPEDEELVCRALQACLGQDEPEKAGELLTLVDVAQPWAAGWKANYLDWNGEYDRANELINRTLELPAGEEPTFLFHAACIAMRRGDPLLAETFVERLLEKDPQHTGALRIRADLSLGRTDYDAAVDPLMKAYALSSDSLTGWQLFWSCLASERFDEAEDTLTTLGEDEELASEPVEAARLELAEALLSTLQGEDHEAIDFSNWEEFPPEASSGLLLQALDFLDETKVEEDGLKHLSRQLTMQLGQQNPVLLLNRCYARKDWPMMKTALGALERCLDAEQSPLPPEVAEATHQAYSMLLALGTENTESVTELEPDLEGEIQQFVLNTLDLRDGLNPTEQRWVDKIRGQQEELTVLEEDPELVDESGQPLAPGGYLDLQDVEVVYETEDGQLLTDVDEDEYEIVEEEAELDPDDPEYEYVWVEEEVQEAATQPVAQSDSYGGQVPQDVEYVEEIVYVDDEEFDEDAEYEYEELEEYEEAE